VVIFPYRNSAYNSDVLEIKWLSSIIFNAA
jgi:hypothetical protein